MSEIALPFGNQAFDAIDEDPYFFVRAFSSVTITFHFAIYVATQEFATKPTDNLPSQPFFGVLEQPFSFRRSILGSEIGIYTVGDGVLEINNTDAFYDFLIQQYAIDGRNIEVKAGRKGDSYNSFFTVFKGTAADWHIDETGVHIILRDFSYKLNVPAQSNIYGGTGGSDGGADLTGKRKPRALGFALNVQPPLVVPSLLIYQVNDGQLQSVDAVYDRGVALSFSASASPDVSGDFPTYAALAAATVAPGYYSTCLAQGFIKLGSQPSGTVTCDLKGDAPSGVFPTTTAAIVRRLLAATSLVDPDDLYLPSFTSVDFYQPANIGYWLGPDETQTVADVIANLMRGIGGWGGFRREGLFEIGIFRSPNLSAADQADLLLRMQRVKFLGQFNGYAGAQGTPSYIDPGVVQTGVTLSNNNLTVTQVTGFANTERSFHSHGYSPGRFRMYCEFTINSAATSDSVAVGICSASEPVGTDMATSTMALGYFNGGGVWYNSGAIAGLSAYTTGDVISMAFDTGLRVVWWRKNGGNWNNDANADPYRGWGGIPLTITTSPDIAQSFNAALEVRNPGNQITVNFGATSYLYPVPESYSNWGMTTPFGGYQPGGDFIDSSIYNRAIVPISTFEGHVDFTEKKFGTGSYRGDNFHASPDTGMGAGFAKDSTGIFFNGNWTFDCWFKPKSYADGTSFDGYCIVAQSSVPISASTMIIQMSGAVAPGFGVYVYLSSDEVSYDIAAATPSSIGGVFNAWNHIAVVRSGSHYLLFVNGQLGLDINDSRNPRFSTSGVIYWLVDGWLDEWRWTDDLARWTSNFTPPSVESVVSPASSIGVPSARYNRTNIFDIKREPLPSSLTPTPWRQRVAYQRVWTTQTDLAGAVSATRKAFVTEPFRLSEANNSAIRTDHPFARDPDPVQSYFADKTDADAEAARRLTLFGASGVALYRIQADQTVLRRNLGECIEVTYPRWDLSTGKLLTIVEINEDVAAKRFEVVAYG